MKPIQSIAELGFPPGFSADLQGWHSDDPFFARVFKDLDPQTVIEVGSWKGASAIHMAGLMSAFFKVDAGQLDLPRIFCVDTWLGGIDHLLNEDTPPNGLLRWHGYPQLYGQFAHNVNLSGFADRIFPVPNTSITGTKLLRHHGILADFIYIDGSHELGDVYADLCAYWPLLRVGGIMAGDDMAFAGVMLDTNRFCLERGLRMKVESDNFWVITRP